MKLLILLVAICLVGCSTTQQVVNTDKQCDKIAWYARATATLRDAGATINDVDGLNKSPTQMSVQLRYIREEVYNTKSKTPADIYTVFYARCVNVGYQAMLAPIPRAPKPQYETWDHAVAIPYDATPGSIGPRAERDRAGDNRICYTNLGECK